MQQDCADAYISILSRNEVDLYKQLCELTNHYAKLFEGADECTDEERIDAIADYF